MRAYSGWLLARCVDKSKGKTAFNEAMACNIRIPIDELLFHLVQSCSPVLALEYGGVA